MSNSLGTQQSVRRWYVCGLLLLALVLNYMDRQTLSSIKPDINRQLGLNDSHYGNLELGFGLAFAFGMLLAGAIADRVNVRWMYPAVLLGWSAAGVASAYADRIGAWFMPLVTNIWGPHETWLGTGVTEEAASAYVGFLVCRIVLGLFEAGQWPCALVTTQRILSREDRSFGNGILQSGASIGAIFTPIVVQMMVHEDVPGSWRGPFMIIGFAGILWVGPWLWLVRNQDLVRPAAENSQTDQLVVSPMDVVSRSLLIRRIGALVVTVIAINAQWQFFRAWLPSFLRDFHHYPAGATNYFTSAYYVATDVGCLATGFAVTFLTARGTRLHFSRMLTFFICAILSSLGVVAAFLDRGPLLLGTLLVIGAGMLGLFPNYYAFTQEISSRHQGKVSRALGSLTWFVGAGLQKLTGDHVQETKSYVAPMVCLSVLPLIAFVAMLLLWGKSAPPPSNKPVT